MEVLVLSMTTTEAQCHVVDGQHKLPKTVMPSNPAGAPKAELCRAEQFSPVWPARVMARAVQLVAVAACY